MHAPFATAAPASDRLDLHGFRLRRRAAVEDS